MSKINIDHKKKDIEIELEEETTIGGVRFRKGKIKVSIKDSKKDEVEVENEKVLSKDITGFVASVSQEKGKDDTEPKQETASDVDVDVKYERGWISNGFRLKKVGEHELKEKEWKGSQTLSAGGDLWGMNYLAWGGLLTVIIGLLGGGYYWWYSSQQEEEEENV